ncbi:MAG: acyl carrier protein [Pseudomonadota bacterium]
MSNQSIEPAIKTYLEDQFLIDFGEDISAQTDLFEAGLIDSYGYIDLVSYLESHFGISISEDELNSSALNSLDGIVAIVGTKTGE